MSKKPITAAMIHAAGKAQPAASNEMANLQATLAEVIVTAFKAFTAAPVRVEPDGLSIAMHEMPMDGGHVVKLISPRGPLTPVLLADRPLTMALCEAAFGGAGTEPVFDGADRPYSATERRLRDALLTELARLLPEALELCFSAPFSSAPEEERKPASRDTVSISCIACRLLVYVYGYSGELTLLLPEEQITKLLAGATAAITESGAATSHGHYIAAVRAAEVEVTVVLPAELKPLSEVAVLRPGQLLKFEANAASPLMLMAGEKLLHHVRMTPSGAHMGIEIIA